MSEEEKRKTAIEMVLKNHATFSKGQPLDNSMPNVVASIMGNIALEISQEPKSDHIDYGLVLLRKLNESGLDVVFKQEQS